MGPSSADVTLLFVIPFLSELKISWAFVAVPLHFQRLGFPLWAFGLTLSVATLCRVPMNTLITLTGDWLLVPLLALATVSAAWMLAAPNTLWAVVAGIVAGHVTDTSQVQASLCYRWQSADPAAQKRLQSRARCRGPGIAHPERCEESAHTNATGSDSSEPSDPHARTRAESCLPLLQRKTIHS